MEFSKSSIHVSESTEQSTKIGPQQFRIHVSESIELLTQISSNVRIYITVTDFSPRGKNCPMLNSSVCVRICRIVYESELPT